MKPQVVLFLLAAALIAFNLADIASTWLSLVSGRGVEANPIIVALGGPFSPLALFLKLVAVPAAILSVAWWLTRRSTDLRLGVVTIILPAAAFAAAAANNVMVAAKKVRKFVDASQDSEAV